jgi:hypothetical protein
LLLLLLREQADIESIFGDSIVDGLNDDWDDTAGADSVAVSIQQPSALGSPSVLPASSSSGGGAGGATASAAAAASGGQSGFAEADLHASEAVLLSSFAYINQIVKGEDLLLRVRRHLWWHAVAVSFVLFHFLIFYFAYTTTVSAHLIWLHLPHILRLPVSWYLAIKTRDVMTMDQLKLVLDSKTPEHLNFFNWSGLVVKAALVSAALGVLAILLDFVAIWVRISTMSVLSLVGFTLPAVFLILDLALFALALWTLLLLPTLQWGVPPELWERLTAHLREYSPFKARQDVGPAAAAAAVAAPAPAPAAPLSTVSSVGTAPLKPSSGRSMPSLGAESYSYPPARAQY